MYFAPLAGKVGCHTISVGFRYLTGRELSTSPQDFRKQSSCQPAHSSPSPAGWLLPVFRTMVICETSPATTGVVSTLAVLQQGQQDGALVMWPLLVKPVVLLALLPLFLLSLLFCYFLHSSHSYPLLIFTESSHLSSASSFTFNVFHNKHRSRNKPVIYFCAHPLKCIL